MNLDLLEQIRARLPQFSKAQKRIAHYILEHYEKAAFMTAARIGSTIGVSESTVVRFAAEVGCDGYPQLQKALQEIIPQPPDLGAAHGDHQRPDRPRQRHQQGAFDGHRAHQAHHGGAGHPEL